MITVNKRGNQQVHMAEKCRPQLLKEMAHGKVIM